MVSDGGSVCRWWSPWVSQVGGMATCRGASPWVLEPSTWLLWVAKPAGISSVQLHLPRGDLLTMHLRFWWARGSLCRLTSIL